MEEDNGRHRTADHVTRMLATAKGINANLLLNSGPLANGAIHPEDVTTLHAVGSQLTAS
jgi:alpha-L-fucosidase